MGQFSYDEDQPGRGDQDTWYQVRCKRSIEVGIIVVRLLEERNITNRDGDEVAKKSICRPGRVQTIAQA